MASQITNKSDGLVLVRLRSGGNLITIEDTTPPDKPSGSAAKRSRGGAVMAVRAMSGWSWR